MDTKEKLEKLIELSNIPHNGGEQFIYVWLQLGTDSGEIRFGFNWKTRMGTIDFHNLDEAINIVTELRKQAVPYEMG